MSILPNLKMSSAGGGQQGIVGGQEGTVEDRSEWQEWRGMVGDSGGQWGTAGDCTSDLS